MKIRINLFIFLVVIINNIFFSLKSFDNLNNMKTYTQRNKEISQIDNNNHLKPDFSSFYERKTPNFLNRVLGKTLDLLKLRTEPWSVNKFKTLLEKVTQQQEARSYKGDYIIKITPQTTTEFVIWGDTQGALHSIYRTLKELKKNRFINEKLEIIKPNCYFIFNGNLVSRSPYILETLTTVLSLINKNPDKVIYIKGEHEYKKNWKNFGLRKELQIKAKYLSKEKTPLKNQIKNFLNSLPLAVYIKLPSTTLPKFIRISYFDRNFLDLNEQMFVSFLKKEPSKLLDIFNLKNGKISNEQINIEAIIKGRKKHLTYQKTDGLELLLPDKGASAWSIFSCPTLTSQKIYNFYNDAFVVLKVNPETEINIITLYKQDATKKAGFSTKCFNLITEDLVTSEIKLVLSDKEKLGVPEKDKSDILLGSSLDLSGVLQDIGKQTLRGLLLRINRENRLGGIRGRKIKLVFKDDKYEPILYEKNIKELNKKNVDIFISPLGSENLKTVLPLLQKNKISIFFPWTGASTFRKKELDNIIHFRASYFNEAEAVTNYAIKKLDYGKIAIFYQNDIFGTSGLNGVKQALKINNISNFKEFSYKTDLSDINKKSKLIMKYNPQTIIFISLAQATIKLINNLDLKFLMRKNLLGISTLSGIYFENFLKEKGLSFHRSQVVPNIETSSLEIVNEYKIEATRANVIPSIHSLESYINTSILIDVLKKIVGKITKEKIIKEFKNTKHYNYKGLHLNFNPETHELADYIFLKTAKNDFIVYPSEEELNKAYRAGKIILVGSSLDLHAVSSLAQKQVYTGLNIFFKKLNAAGGIDGRELKLIALNDRYTPELTRKNINTLLNTYKTSIILVIGGTPTTKAVLPKVKDKEILVAFPYTGANIFRQPELTYFLHMKNSYENEVKLLIKYAVKKLKLKKFALFYQEDEYGLDCLRGAQKALKKMGIKNWCQTSYKRGTTQVDNAAKKIEEYNPDAIMFFSTEKPGKALINKIGIQKLLPKELFAVSFMSNEFKESLRKNGLKITISSTVPNPTNNNIQIVEEYNADVKKHGKNEALNPSSLSGYIYAAVFSDLLKKIEGDITKEKIIKQAEKIKNYNFKGLYLNFDYNTKELFKDIWINTSDDKWIYHGYNKEEVIAEETVEKNIHLGTSLPISGIRAKTANGLLSGMFLCINRENRESNIQTKLTYFDDKLQPDLTKKNIQKLLSSGVDKIIQPVSSLLLESYLPIIKQKKVVTFSGTTSPIFRNPEYKNLIHYLPAADKNAATITEYAIKELNIKKIAILYKEEIAGEQALKGTKEVLRKYNFKENVNWIAIGHLPEVIDVKNASDKIKQFSPDAILHLSDKPQLKNLINNLGLDFLYKVTILGLHSGTNRRHLTRDRGIKYVGLQFVPDPKTSNLEIAKEYRNEAIEQGKELTELGLEGYLGMSIFIDIIKKIPGEITKEKIIQQAEKIKNYNFKGLYLNFNPQTRNLSNNIWIDVEDDKIIFYKSREEIKEEKESKITQEKKYIEIGSTMDLSEEMSFLNKPVLEGIFLRINQLNKNKGINGKLLKFTCLNDKYSSILAKKNLKTLLDKKINIIFQVAGSIILQALLPYITENKIVAIFPDATSPIFYKPELKNLINFFPSSHQNASMLIKYLINKEKIKKIAIVYQNDPYGKGALLGAKETLEKYNLKENINWIAVSHLPNNIDNPQVAEKIKAFNPKFILHLSFFSSLKALIKRLGISFLYNKIITKIEISEIEKEYLKRKNIKLIGTQPTPDIQKSQLEIVQNYKKRAIEKNKFLNTDSFRGYLIADVFIDALKKIEGNITKEKVIEQIEKIKNYNFKGLHLNFNPETRNISNNLWIYTKENNVIFYKPEKFSIKQKEQTPSLEVN